jgi:hypothetical protein
MHLSTAQQRAVQFFDECAAAAPMPALAPVMMPFSPMALVLHGHDDFAPSVALLVVLVAA